MFYAVLPKYYWFKLFFFVHLFIIPLLPFVFYAFSGVLLALAAILRFPPNRKAADIITFLSRLSRSTPKSSRPSFHLLVTVFLPYMHPLSRQSMY